MKFFDEVFKCTFVAGNTSISIGALNTVAFF